MLDKSGGGRGGNDLLRLNLSFERALRAQNRSPRTITIYTDVVRRFATFLEEHHLPTERDAITREHV
jgi:hypothetical protein